MFAIRCLPPGCPQPRECFEYLQRRTWWRNDRYPGKQLNGLMGTWKGIGRDGHGGTQTERDLQINVPKHLTDCQMRTGVGQTEGQISRRAESAKADKQTVQNVL